MSKREEATEEEGVGAGGERKKKRDLEREKNEDGGYRMKKQ